MSLFEGLLQRYGQRVLLWREGAEEGTACRAFLQPIRERGEQAQASPLGAVRQDKWLCLGEPGIALEGLGDGFIQWAGRRFRVISAQPVLPGDGIVPLAGRAAAHGRGLTGNAEGEESMTLDTVRERMAECLRKAGVEAVCAWPGGARRRVQGPVAAVSLRSCQGGPGGFPGLSGGALQPGAGLLGGALRTEGAAGIRAGSVCAGARRRSGAPDRL